MKRIITIFAGLLAMVSCSIEPIEPEIEFLVPMTVSADMSDSGTKAWLNGLQVLWSENDKIAVYDGSAVREFTLISGAGSKHAIFSGEVAQSATSFTAVYPYSAAGIQNKELIVSVPSTQIISNNSVDENALVMSASAQKGECFQFRNQASLLRFSVPSGISQVLVASSDKKLVSLSLPGNAGTFEAAITPGLYNDLFIFAKSGDSWYLKTSDKEKDVERNKILVIGDIPLTQEALPIRTASEMSAFLKDAGGFDSRSVFLLTNLDMSLTTYTPADDFAGMLNGLGHTVSCLNKPLFTANHGSVSNMTLTGTISGTQKELAPLAVYNYGPLSRIINKTNISVKETSDQTDAIVIGGIAAYSYGIIDSCINEGSLSFSCTSSMTAAALGGIAGYAEAAISECTNSGVVSLSALCGSGMAELGKISASACNIGGIIGAAYSGAPVDGCVNTGAISFNHSAIEKFPGTTSYERNQIGGIAGSPYGDISNCRNYGNLDIKATTSDRSAYTTYSYIIEAGGISGGNYCQELAYKSPNDKTSVIDCRNEGNITVAVDGTKSYSPFGGIVGWPNGEKTGIKCKTLRCSNSGRITMSGAGKVRLGGIMGGTGTIENCDNSGTVHVEAAYSDSSIGGIAGFHSQDHGLSGCSNTGDVISKVAISAAAGLIGNYGNVELDCCAACKVDCTVENGASARGGTGIIIGLFNGDGKSITIGTEAQPVEVSGTLILSNQGYIVDEVTYTSLLAGTTKSSDLHVFYAVCNVPHSSESYSVEGYVKYSDGNPAAGITVSDGFNVSRTDAQGHYSLLTSADTWYIYISLPSDAVINKNANGSPDFFVRYKYPVSRYDFTLTRQSVENEFALFAMADPQAHNSIRSGQTKADVYRFRDEAVPAINSQITAQGIPCYGVTLGDIVYSENGRNSNGGMSTMRSYFKNVNMPVFQTMGNHDFTYFYSSTPLTTDASSSTLYLKAQRKFEDAFGPINYSFNRGNVHVVCMRDIIYDSNTANSSYHGGFTDAQYAWLKQDLANVPKSKMVVLCVHIPLYNITSKEHVTDVINLIKQYASAKIFSGHTHYKHYYPNIKSTGVNEHIHSAVCGQWWWSNIEGDGNPNGYTIYKIKGTSIVDEYFIGQNTHMNTRDYQMRLYRGNLKSGGQYAYFQWPHDASKLLINVFNGDSRWSVKVYENGVYSGTASMMSNSKQTYDSVTAGETYTVNAASNQDWWAIGYHIGVIGRGTTSTGYYTNMFHMFTYTLKNSDASVKVVATDGYGNSYECTDVVSEDCWYPTYIKMGNVN